MRGQSAAHLRAQQWRNELLGEPKLWNALDVSLNDVASDHLARLFAGRSGGLDSLTIRSEYTLMEGPMRVYDRTRAVLRAIAESGAATTLTTLAVRFEEMRPVDQDDAYKAIGAVLSFAENAAVNLAHLTFDCQSLPILPIRSGFWACFPTLKSFTVEMMFDSDPAVGLCDVVRRRALKRTTERSS